MEYGHGGDIYTYENMLDFSVNVNPLGISETAVQAAKRGVEQSGNYPDSRCRRLTKALSETMGLPQSYFLAGNGAADLFYSLVLAERPKQALLPVPAFSEYEQALKTADCRIRYHELKRENRFRIDESILEELTEDLDIVFLCSPSNPAGQALGKDLAVKIAERCREKKIRLVLDECFIEFLSDPEAYSMMREVEKFQCLFLVRAFTKMHAMPGLRLGYALSSDEELLERIQQIRQPWSVSVPAQEAGIAVLAETERTEQTRQLIKKERRKLESGLRDLGIEVIPSEANFLLMNCPLDLFSLLKEKQILIRDCSNYKGLGKGWYRIAVRTAQENDRLLKAVREVVSASEGKENG